MSPAARQNAGKGGRSLSEPGFQLGDDYIDIQPLMEGGVGTLYKAYRRGLGVKVVIKRVQSKYVGRIDQKAEANILKCLKHRYLPRIYDIINGQDGYFYTVMDYISGTNLQDYVKNNGPADQKTAHKWACQLCEVTSYLHEQHPPIIHCDIKPNNLMVTGSGDICLIDFNTSHICEGTAGVPAKSPGFAAPEQYVQFSAQRAEKRVTVVSATQTTVLVDENEEMPGTGTAITKRTDVYGIGATLYYLVTGHVPESSLDPLTPLHNFPLKISETFCSIIERAMSKEPEKRFADAAEMLRAVQDVDKLDARYRHYQNIRRVSLCLLGVLFALSAASSLYGVLQLRAERGSAYLQTVSQADALATQGENEQAADMLEQAIQSSPGRPEAYLALSAQLYGQGNYRQAYDLIQNALEEGSLQLERVTPDQAGDLLYVQANCVYEQGDYEGAIQLYNRALEYRQDNLAYYRGLALAQARSGDLVEAQKTLDMLQQNGASSVDCKIVRAQISVASGEYETAIQQYQNVIAQAQDTQTLSRAYLSAAQVYEELGDVDGRIELLSQAVEQLDENGYLQEEMLAQAYADKALQDEQNSTACYEKARMHLEHVLENGRGNILTELNLVVILQNLDAFQEAETHLVDLAAQYPGDYRVYMRLAFLYADWQSQLPLEQRDYTSTMKNYQLAQEYYEQAVANGTSDMEMSRLDALIEQLRISGWLD